MHKFEHLSNQERFFSRFVGEKDSRVQVVKGSSEYKRLNQDGIDFDLHLNPLSIIRNI